MLRQTFNQRVVPYFILSLVIATIGAGVGTKISPALYIPIVIAELIFLFLAFIFRKFGGDANPLFTWAFVALSGCTMGIVVNQYIIGSTNGSVIVAEAFGLTCLIFILLGGYAYITGKDFRNLGGILFSILITIIVASLVNIFVRLPGLQLLISIIATFLFSGYILYDISSILRTYSDDQVNSAVLALYIDFLNLFINILEILGFINRED